MEFKLEHEVDKGPLVRWIANKTISISDKISKWAYPYADMYTAVWDDYEDDNNLSVPHNQMGIFDNLEPLPQFEKIDKGLL
jgi:hypothetical protein